MDEPPGGKRKGGRKQIENKGTERLKDPLRCLSFVTMHAKTGLIGYFVLILGAIKPVAIRLYRHFKLLNELRRWAESVLVRIWRIFE